MKGNKMEIVDNLSISVMQNINRDLLKFFSSRTKKEMSDYQVKNRLTEIFIRKNIVETEFITNRANVLVNKLFETNVNNLKDNKFNFLNKEINVIPSRYDNVRMYLDETFGGTKVVICIPTNGLVIQKAKVIKTKDEIKVLRLDGKIETAKVNNGGVKVDNAFKYIATNILSIDKLEAKEVTNLDYLFYGSTIKELIVRGGNLEDVKSMRHTFDINGLNKLILFAIKAPKDCIVTMMLGNIITGKPQSAIIDLRSFRCTNFRNISKIANINKDNVEAWDNMLNKAYSSPNEYANILLSSNKCLIDGIKRRTRSVYES